MSRQDRSNSSGSSGMSREKFREDYYRNQVDDNKDRSRSGRDNNRDRDRHRRRERSRSKERRPRRSRSRDDRNRHRTKQRDSADRTDTRVREMSISPPKEDEDDGIPAAPPAPRISKISIGFNKPPPKPQPIKMTLNPFAAPTNTAQKPTAVLKPKVASVFDDGSDDEPEEMPAEARMRMRNIGRETPTSAGPNSFGKTKHGFCDAKNIFQRNLKEAMEKISPTSNASPKFQNAIYKQQPQ